MWLKSQPQTDRAVACSPALLCWKGQSASLRYVMASAAIAWRDTTQ